MASPSPTIPPTMRAIRYTAPRSFSLVTLPVPLPRAHEALVRVRSCGVCGTDVHIHNGDFPTRMPVVTGHETSGVVVALGEDVSNKDGEDEEGEEGAGGLKIGDRVTADNGEMHCGGACHYCRQGKSLYCEKFEAHGISLNGGFAEYAVYPASKLFRLSPTLTWLSAAVLEAASCAVHGLDRLAPAVGHSALVIGAGATGLCLAQLLRANGAARLVLAAPEGPKLGLARTLGCADEYLGLERGVGADGVEKAEKQWRTLMEENKYGFDVVVEASGNAAVLERAVDFCAKGGKLLYYGVYEKDATIRVSPSKVFRDEITMLGSVSQVWCMPRSVRYLESGVVKTEGMVDRTFRLEEFGDALEAIRRKECIKAAIVFD